MDTCVKRGAELLTELDQTVRRLPDRPGKPKLVVRVNGEGRASNSGRISHACWGRLVVAEAKTQVWEESVEAMEKNLWLVSRKF